MKEKLSFTFYDYINPETNVESSDAGCTLTTNVAYDENGDTQKKGLFVIIQSWDEDQRHFDFKQLLHRRVRVTIETID
jgi:hypothetical protein